MSDNSSVAPRQTQQNFSESADFAAALQRAKQIAAKIHPSGTAQGTKRSLEGGLERESKKMSMSPAAMDGSCAENTVTEDIKLPDKIAASFAGRSGSDDPFSKLQNESGCKLVLSRDQDRVATLTGTRESVNHAKELLLQMCTQQKCGTIVTISCINVPPASGAGFPPYQELMVPGSKVGLIIGKGGETIKMLQEKTGAKMVIIQDGPGQELEKPLRISGDPQKVEHAKQLVFDLILDKEAVRKNHSFNSGGSEEAEIFVPKTAVGVVIGKGGDMIKKIQGETGCKLQFIEDKGDAPGDRRCLISGTKQQVEDGKKTVVELIDSRINQSGGGGEGSGGSNGGGTNNRNSMNNSANSNYGYGSDSNQQLMREEVSFAVPASKCGIVIGRGGETIKLINQQSGAFCEMNRGAINPPSEKMFKMKGSSEQIEHARQMISEKIGVEISILSTRQIGSGGGSGGNGGNYGGGMQGNGGSGAYGQQQQQQQQHQEWCYQPQSWDQQAQQQQQQQQMDSTTGQSDYTAQWIDYYKLIGLCREAEIIEQQLKGKQGGPIINLNVSVPTANSAQLQQQQASGMQAAAQPDYSKQWAEYYRSIGKIDEAEIIESQIKAAKPAQMPGDAQTPVAAAVAAVPGYPGQAAQGMARYNQYTQYYTGAAAAQPGYAQAAYGAYGGYPGQQPLMPSWGQPQQGGDQN